MNSETCDLLRVWNKGYYSSLTHSSLVFTQNTVSANNSTFARRCARLNTVLISDLKLTEPNGQYAEFLKKGAGFVIPNVNDTVAFNTQAMVSQVNTLAKAVRAALTWPTYDERLQRLRAKSTVLAAYTEFEIVSNIEELIFQHATPKQLARMVAWRMLK